MGEDERFGIEGSEETVEGLGWDVGLVQRAVGPCHCFGGSEGFCLLCFVFLYLLRKSFDEVLGFLLVGSFYLDWFQ